MRVLATVAALTALALLSGYAVYAWRSPSEPVRVEPIQLLPPPERQSRGDAKGARQATERPERRESGSEPAPRRPRSGALPAAPAPAPAGEEDDGGGDGDDEDDDDEDDGGGDD